MTVKAAWMKPGFVCPADTHNTYDAYNNHGCRCELATKLYWRRRKERELGTMRGVEYRVNPVGVARRLQALAYMGYTFMEIKQRTGLHRSNMTLLAAGDHRFVYRTTAEKLKAFYEEVCMFPVEGWVADRQRRRARKLGYVGPLAWDDDTIDDPEATAQL